MPPALWHACCPLCTAPLLVVLPLPAFLASSACRLLTQKRQYHCITPCFADIASLCSPLRRGRGWTPRRQQKPRRQRRGRRPRRQSWQRRRRACASCRHSSSPRPSSGWEQRGGTVCAAACFLAGMARFLDTGARRCVNARLPPLSLAHVAEVVYIAGCHHKEREY